MGSLAWLDVWDNIRIIASILYFNLVFLQKGTILEQVSTIEKSRGKMALFKFFWPLGNKLLIS